MPQRPQFRDVEKAETVLIDPEVKRLGIDIQPVQHCGSLRQTCCQGQHGGTKNDLIAIGHVLLCGFDRLRMGGLWGRRLTLM